MQEKRLRKKYKVKKKRPPLENNFLSGVLFFLFFLTGGIYFFVFYPFFQVDSVRLEGDENIRKEDLAEIRGYFNENLSFFETESIFFVSPEEIESGIKSEFPSVGKVSVKRIFPSKVNIHTESRSPVAFWCEDVEAEVCYYIDKKGIVYEETKKREDDLLSIVKKVDLQKGERLVEERVLDRFFLVKDTLEEEGVEVKDSYLTTGESLEFLTNEGWSVYFFKNRIEEGLRDLEVVIEKLEKEDLKEIDYIDVRFEGRVYYQ